MPDRKSYFFISYSREDLSKVQPIVDQLQAAGIPIWVDISELEAGENWQRTVAEALNNAAGIIVFVSQASMESKWVLSELNYALGRGARVIPVLIERVELPYQLLTIQYVDLSRPSEGDGVAILIETLHYWLGEKTSNSGLRREEIEEIVSETVEQARGIKGVSRSDAVPDSVFIVHGHNQQFLGNVKNFIISLGIKPIVLSEMPNAQQSLLQKFLTWSQDTRFAIVLISPDDRGAARRQFDKPHGVGEKALQFRARQNVILELGFFYGHLGWENVFVLFQQPNDVFPNFERPSDLDGVPWDEVDASENWKHILQNRLHKAGFVIH